MRCAEVTTTRCRDGALDSAQPDWAGGEESWYWMTWRFFLFRATDSIVRQRSPTSSGKSPYPQTSRRAAAGTRGLPAGLRARH